MRSNQSTATAFSTSARQSVAIGRQMIAAEKAEELMKKQEKLDKKKAKKSGNLSNNKDSKKPGIKKVLQSHIDAVFTNLLSKDPEITQGKVATAVQNLHNELKLRGITEGTFVFGNIDLLNETDLPAIVSAIQDFKKEILKFTWKVYSRNSDIMKKNLLAIAAKTDTESKNAGDVIGKYLHETFGAENPFDKYQGTTGAIEMLTNHPFDFKKTFDTEDITTAAMVLSVISMSSMSETGLLKHFLDENPESYSIEMLVLGSMYSYYTGHAFMSGAVSFMEKKAKKLGLPNFLTKDFLVIDDVTGDGTTPSLKVGENGEAVVTLTGKEPKVVVKVPKEAESVSVTLPEGQATGGGSTGTAIAAALQQAAANKAAKPKAAEAKKTASK